MPDSVSRYVPDELIPVVEQGILNLIHSGYTITDSHGMELRPQYNKLAEGINKRYDQFVMTYRRRKITRTS